MKANFHFYENRFIIFDDIKFSNRRRFKAIKLNCENSFSLLYRRFRRRKVMIYYSFKNVNDIE